MQDETQYIISLAEKGISYNQIMRTLPYPKSQAKRIIRKLRKDGLLVKAKKSEKVLESYKNGICDVNELAEMYNSTTTSISQILLKGGVRRKRKPTNTKKRELGDRTKAILESLENGKGVRATAREFGVSAQRVSDIKKEYLEKEK